MPFPDLTWRNILPAAVLQEMEQFSAMLFGWMSTEHKQDGSHGDVSADSLTLTEHAASGATGNLTADGAGNHVIGPVTIADALSTGSGTGTGQGLKLTGTNRAWAFKINSDSFGEAFMLIDATAARRVLALYRTAAVFGMSLGDYLLAPSADGIGVVHLGLPGFNSSDLELDTLAAKNGYFRTALYERGRTVALGVWQTFSPTWTNVTVGNGTVTARYTYIAGKTIAYTIKLVFGTTTAITGAASVTTPATMAFPTNSQHQAEYLDATAGTFGGLAFPLSATNLGLYDVASPRAVVTSTVPFTWGTSDELHLSGLFEEA